MGIGDTLKKALGFSEEEEYEEIIEDDELPADDEILAPAEDTSGDRHSAARHKKASFSDGLTLGGSGKMEFVVVKPTDFGSECTNIADHLLLKKTVVLNLESTPKDSSRRIIDFVSGVAYAVKAKIKKVATCTYVIIPDNSDFSGEESYESESELSNSIY